MIRRIDNDVPLARADLSPWRQAQATAKALSFRQALHFEEAGWPTDLVRQAFWRQPSIPEEHRGVEAPGRPDPRVVLTGNDRAIEELRAADEAWKEASAEWSRSRLEWLRGQAVKLGS